MAGLATRSASSYTIPGRLQDVMALIQVLALDTDTHRSLEDLQGELQRTPASADSWTAIAFAHPEFFRYEKTGAREDRPLSLVARHVIRRLGGTRPTPSGLLAQLLKTAIDLHDREARRAERWTVWLPLWGVVIGAVISGVVAIPATLLTIMHGPVH